MSKNLPTLHLKQMGYNSNAPPAVLPAMNEKATEAYLNLTQQRPPLSQWTEGEAFEQLIAGYYVETRKVRLSSNGLFSV